jgi:Rrf2 family protein
MGSHEREATVKVSTKGRYGLRLLIDVAMHQDKGPVILRDIAERQGISEKYLWQVINPLKSAGIVTAIRGAHGGYTLARQTGMISLLEVISALEGPISLVDCTDSPADCNRSAGCVARDVWSALGASLRDKMAGITLKDLVEKQRGLEAGNTPNYVI